MFKSKWSIIFIVLVSLVIVSCASSNDEITDQLSLGEVDPNPQTDVDNTNIDQVAIEAEEDINPESEEPPLPAILPNEPPQPERTLVDSDSSLRAYENRVLSGDNFSNNLYERPFTAIDMIYQPDLDIYSVEFSYDDFFFYFTINLNGKNPEKWELSGLYCIEFDRSLSGRGDFLVCTENAGGDWSTDHVVLYQDNNADVGGPMPTKWDRGFTGNGYDGETTFEDDKVAFSRVSPDDDEAIQFAVSRALLDNPDQFLWGAWADGGLKQVRKFDYNDTMRPSEAGSPFIDNEYYPIEGLFSLDNTCRFPYGFAQMGSSYPGICISIPPVSTQEKDGPQCPTSCPQFYTLYNCQCILFN